ncbi:SDR family NAD(P)-dependent oxidoreductase [Polymorphobacter fuscus]|uniref:SDR family oxidoreductase n=1 Tax=Sandarakinorhabdus fusca TaxID=1439888 RepID=A0A7C9KWP7_9SPHN|nr:SDR family NAD(P)-dependent oxidoreductase [Polymorphobacter fuscus]KAB7648633.1 SDR family oxidoreductase [Polymorphobacter fuscus]MQT16186.1 SDR family oxidoreductase [Polymorphobacter fuscus]
MSWAMGQTALVTGGSQGIGHATAAALAAQGAQVTVTGTRPSFADYDAPIEGVAYIQADLATPAARVAVAERFSALDVLGNNAGGGSANEYDQDQFEAVIDLNLNAVMDLSVRLFPLLKAARGSVVNVGSLASFLALKEVPAYTASKAGLLGLTRALGDKWATDGVRVNLVAPGFIATRMTERMRVDAAYEARLLKAVPMRRWGEPGEIADAILFLASPAASYITGQSLAIDGGLMLR